MDAAGERIPASSRAVVRPDVPIALEAGETACELLLLQGRPIGEPVVQYGPFVMNTPHEIEGAIDDYQRTRFGGWPFDSDGPVHARDEKRFARHADGRIEHASYADGRIEHASYADGRIEHASYADARLVRRRG